MLLLRQTILSMYFFIDKYRYECSFHWQIQVSWYCLSKDLRKGLVIAFWRRSLLLQLSIRFITSFGKSLFLIRAQFLYFRKKTKTNENTKFMTDVESVFWQRLWKSLFYRLLTVDKYNKILITFWSFESIVVTQALLLGSCNKIV